MTHVSHHEQITPCVEYVFSHVISYNSLFSLSLLGYSSRVVFSVSGAVGANAPADCSCLCSRFLALGSLRIRRHCVRLSGAGDWC